MGRQQPTRAIRWSRGEVWQKVRAGVIEADVWIYDPQLYLEPWYLKRGYSQVPTSTGRADSVLELHENPNNEVYKTPTAAPIQGFHFWGKRTIEGAKAMTGIG